MNILSFNKAAIVLIWVASCTSLSDREQIPRNEYGVPQYTQVQSGNVKMITVDQKYRVWTKKVGEGSIKVLLLHGGPAFTHDYMECFDNFLPQSGIEFYYYDQLGCGNSDIPADTSLWRIDRFVEEVEQVREGLQLSDFYLFGHSWGSMLAMEYSYRYPDHLKGVVFSNMTAGAKEYLNYTSSLKTKFFSSTDIRTFDSLDQLGQYTAPAYQDLLMSKLYRHVICQLDPWPEPVTRSFRLANFSIYTQMQGVDEFHVTGNLRSWTMWDRLKDIRTPALVLGGVNDEMSPDDMKREAELLPNSRLYLCPQGSHLSMYDDQQNYFNALISFLKEVEMGKFIAQAKL